jgi:uncharacterized membrane-anchored protein YitT (DUF2179 family)
MNKRYSTLYVFLSAFLLICCVYFATASANAPDESSSSWIYAIISGASGGLFVGRLYSDIERR